MSERPFAFRILPTFQLLFLGYLALNLGVSVLPVFIRRELGFPASVVGIVFALQYVAAFCIRGFAGSFSDSHGPRRAAQMGLGLSIGAGLLLAAAGLCKTFPLMALLWLGATRLALGCAESFISTSVSIWGISRVGRTYTGRVLAWSGVASYGSFAAGAPLGGWIYAHLHLAALGGATALIAAVATLMSMLLPTPKAVHQTTRQASTRTFMQVLPYGLILMLGATGFATLSSFGPLFFDAEKWTDAPLALTLYGTSFVLVRLLCGGAFKRFEPLRVASVSLAVEAAGLTLLAASRTASWALLASILIGSGSSLVFPLLGAEVIYKVGERDESSALSLFTAFISISIGLASACAGFVTASNGFRSLYGTSTLCVLVASAVCGIWAGKSVSRDSG